MDIDEAIKLRLESIDVLAMFSIPLYVDKNGLPDQIGSGFFVQDGNDCYLVSAAHTFDRKGLFYYSKPNQHRILTGSVFRNISPEIDVGVTKLANSNLPPYKEIGKHALDISFLKPMHLPRTRKEYINRVGPSKTTLRYWDLKINNYKTSILTA